jgi:hypothetical protein
VANVRGLQILHRPGACWHSFSLPISRTRVNYRKRRRWVQVLFATNIAMALINDWSKVPSSTGQGMCGRQKRIEIRIERITCMASKKLCLTWMTYFYLNLPIRPENEFRLPILPSVYFSYLTVLSEE